MGFDRKAYKKEWDRNRWVHIRDLLARYKTFKGCIDCGYNEHFAALVFDHVDPSTKDRSKRNGRSINFKWSKKKIKEELVKCEVRCANCHQARTYNEGHHILGKGGI